MNKPTATPTALIRAPERIRLTPDLPQPRTPRLQVNRSPERITLGDVTLVAAEQPLTLRELIEVKQLCELDGIDPYLWAGVPVAVSMPHIKTGRTKHPRFLVLAGLGEKLLVEPDDWHRLERDGYITRLSHPCPDDSHA